MNSDRNVERAASPESGRAPALPLACMAGAIDSAERPAHFALIARLFTTGALERRQEPDGYAYRFDANAFDDLARFVANERRCCPFLAFALEPSADGGPLWLRLAGPAGARAFLDAELPHRT